MASVKQNDTLLSDEEKQKVFFSMIEKNDVNWIKYWKDNQFILDPNYWEENFEDTNESILCLCLKKKNYEAFYLFLVKKKDIIDLKKDCQKKLLYYLIKSKDERKNYEFSCQLVLELFSIFTKNLNSVEVQNVMNFEIEYGYKVTTLLHVAIKRKEPKLIQWILEKNPNLNLIDTSELTPLELAKCDKNNVEIIQMLRDKVK